MFVHMSQRRTNASRYGLKSRIPTLSWLLVKVCLLSTIFRATVGAYAQDNSRVLCTNHLRPRNNRNAKGG